MARPGLTSHPKFKRLASMIGGRALALGSLEFLWEAAGLNGNPVIGDSISVEAAAEWVGEPGVLTKALLGAGGAGRNGFIDQREDGLFEVHDFFHHCPQYVNGRKGREAERLVTKACEVCGGAYHSSDPRSQYCSPACKQNSYRRRVTDIGNGIGNAEEAQVTDSLADASRVTEVVTEVVTALPTVTDRYHSPASRIPHPAPASRSQSLFGETSQEALPAASRRERRSPPLEEEPCSDPRAADMPLAKLGETWAASKKLIQTMEQAFPDLDVLAEVAKAKAWLLANKSKRKTPGGMPRFLNNWLARAQNGNGMRRNASASGNVELTDKPRWTENPPFATKQICEGEVVAAARGLMPDQEIFDMVREIDAVPMNNQALREWTDRKIAELKRQRRFEEGMTSVEAHA